MPLFLVRHAHAVSESDDRKRPLSDRGRTQVRTLVDFFRRNNQFTPAFVWHSPLLRARETAEILIHGLNSEAALVETPGLLPDDNPGQIAERIRSLNTAVNIAVVGHQPHLATLASILFENAAAAHLIDFKKAAVLALERTPPVVRKGERSFWQVSWFVSAELLTPRLVAPATESPWPR
jgi:phosphohistidine phosphatase